MGGMSLHCHLVFLEDAFSISTVAVRPGRMELVELFPYETCCQSQSSALQRRLLRVHALCQTYAAPSSPAPACCSRAQPSSKGFWTLRVWQDAGMTSISNFSSCSALSFAEKAEGVTFLSYLSVTTFHHGGAKAGPRCASAVPAAGSRGIEACSRQAAPCPELVCCKAWAGTGHAHRAAACSAASTPGKVPCSQCCQRVRSPPCSVPLGDALIPGQELAALQQHRNTFSEEGSISLLAEYILGSARSSKAGRPGAHEQHSLVLPASLHSLDTGASI